MEFTHHMAGIVFGKTKIGKSLEFGVKE